MIRLSAKIDFMLFLAYFLKTGHISFTRRQRDRETKNGTVCDHMQVTLCSYKTSNVYKDSQ